MLRRIHPRRSRPERPTDAATDDVPTRGGIPGEGIDTAAGRQVEPVRSAGLGGLPAYRLGGAAAGGWVRAPAVPGRGDAGIVGARPVRPGQQPPHHLRQFFPANQHGVSVTVLSPAATGCSEPGMIVGHGADCAQGDWQRGDHRRFRAGR